MNEKELHRLERLNQLSLTEEEKGKLSEFFARCAEDFAPVFSVDTENVERMVHVMPMVNIIREDVEIKKFQREDLQKNAPETVDGYWQVPRLVD